MHGTGESTVTALVGGVLLEHIVATQWLRFLTCIDVKFFTRNEPVNNDLKFGSCFICITCLMKI